ncbi:hypothetical protein [Photobacterium galatheae]|uniref:Lipoprotein n=1 Tax=Photobacterium galatheae TaxID=1654360 RepID=A0A066RUD6_9GAMM|nr:hypothetical protein [Photobacterium galatheae]KDM91307.1 hypothetical protein EA58_12105 [Photobacterium galatheae]MCM0150292.1 hypothetical protein [Photobacterium galatheae]
MKKSLLSLLVSTAILSGCGGGSDSDGDPSPGENTQTIQVIDGYLSNAEVCVDRNSNLACDTGEVLSKRTNANGEVAIQKSDQQYRLIARVIAGETTDSDHSGYVWKDAELLAGAGNVVVTPFSTLAQMNDQTLDEFAASLNLDPALLKNDYVALKASNPEAKKVHLYARTMTKMLGETLNDNEPETQKVQIQALKSRIQTLENNNVDFDSVTLAVNDQGDVTQTERVKGLKTFLERGEPVFLEFPNIGVRIPHQLKFEAGKITSSSIGFIGDGTPYRVSGMTLSVGSQPAVTAKFLYLSSDFAVGNLFYDVSNKLLAVWQTKATFQEAGTQLTADDFIGKRWYHLRDLAEFQNDVPPIPALTQLTFTTDTTVMVKPFGEAEFEASWSFESKLTTPSPSQPALPYQTISIQFGHVPQNPKLGNETQMVMSSYLARDEVILLDQDYQPAPLTVILTPNKALAEAMYKNWK